MVLRTLRAMLLAVACLGVAVAPVGAVEPGELPVAVYVNVDEMSALWPFRDPETGTFPGPGDPGHEAYQARWNEVIAHAFEQLRRRVPPEFELIAANDPDAPYALKIDVWIADMSTSCNAPTFYKYLWVRTYPGAGGIVTNWDGLGVRSDTLVSVEMTESERRLADLDAWVELWAQVPYLHLRIAPEEAPQDAPEAAPPAGSEA